MITRAKNNQIVWCWDAADPFGMQQPGEDPSGLGGFTYNPRFPGQLYDKETNLHYSGYRNYDPQQGRYVESDSIGLAGGINTDAYVKGDPVSYVDPHGLDRWGSYGYGPYVPVTNPLPTFWERLNFSQTPEQRAFGKNIIYGFAGGMGIGGKAGLYAVSSGI